jgi:hypothetical protein
MKKILSYALIIAMLASTSCSKDEEDNSVVPIPDPAFKAFLLADYDYNHNGEISFSEAQYITQVWIENMPEITSINGIEYFDKLTGLIIKNSNNILSLDISKNIQLSDFVYEGTGISSFDFSKNINLNRLHIVGTNMTSLDVSSNINLEYIGCSNNKLASIDVSNNVNLTGLDCDNNQITELDLSKNVLLAYLDCSFNKLTTLYLRYNYNMGYICCYFNNIINLFLIEGHEYDQILKDEFTVIVRG